MAEKVWLVAHFNESHPVIPLKGWDMCLIESGDFADAFHDNVQRWQTQQTSLTTCTLAYFPQTPIGAHIVQGELHQSKLTLNWKVVASMTW